MNTEWASIIIMVMISITIIATLLGIAIGIFRGIIKDMKEEGITWKDVFEIDET